MIVRATASGIEVWAPAKLNLFLEIQGKRSDGYHEIETLMVPVALYDTLLISPTEPAETKAEIQLTIDSGEQRPARSGEDVAPTSAENTVIRAVEALRSRCESNSKLVQTRADLAVRLIKRIPVAAGLAGGSSDAAAALRAVAGMWQMKNCDEQLTAAAADVGSDIPFFLAGGAAVCRGRGERITKTPLPRLHFVIAKPRVGLSTAEVYRACQPAIATKSVDQLVTALRVGDRVGIRQALHNGLEPAAESLCPEIGNIRRAFARQNVIAHQMSGSGTSYFGLCASARGARSVAARLRSQDLGHVFTVSSCL